MPRVSQTHYYVPGRERRRRSFMKRIKYPVLTLLVLVGAGYTGYLYRPVVTVNAPLANATADTSVAPTATPVQTVAPVTADATKVAPATEIPDISAVITRTGLDQNRAQTWSVAVYDLTSNAWVAQVNPHQQIVSASLYKLYVAYALSKKVSFGDWQSKQVGGHSLKDCVDLMLRVSDNNCGIAVGGFVGWDNVDKEARKYGFSGTVMSKPGGSVTTAADSATFMSDLYQGKLFDKDATSFVLDSLHKQQYRTGIPAGCPGCTVYNKTGNEGGVTHDVAIVQSGSHTYAVAIMSEGGTAYKIANVERSIEAAFKAVP